MEPSLTQTAGSARPLKANQAPGELYHEAPSCDPFSGLSILGGSIMAAGDSIRVLMYSHDTYGLGHLTRTLRIGRALRDQREHLSVLILTGSPVAPYMPLPPGADFVKLPSVVKSGPDRYRSRDLEVSFSQVKKIRRDLCLKAAESFRPHLFLVDNVPLGMKGEVVPTLRALRSGNPHCRILLNLRDILDDPAAIRSAWARDGVYEALAEYYDGIFVLGDSSIFDPISAYGLPSSKTTIVGYAAPGPRIVPSPRARTPREARVLLTAGGGGDGAEFLKTTLDGVQRLAHSGAAGRLRWKIQIEVVTGPLMMPEDRAEIGRMARRAEAELHEFVPDLPRRMSCADLAVAMAGYNTFCEILCRARAALVYPRVTPRVEQLIRARAFRDRGVVSMLEPDALTPETVCEAVERSLTGGPTIQDENLPEMNGLQRLAASVVRRYLPPMRGTLQAPSAMLREVPAPPPTSRSDARSQAPAGTAYWYWPGAMASPGSSFYNW